MRDGIRGDSQVTALGVTLQSNTHLVMLELARNGLDDVGITLLAAGLQANLASALTSLKLTHGNQGANGNDGVFLDA